MTNVQIKSNKELVERVFDIKKEIGWIRANTFSRVEYERQVRLLLDKLEKKENKEKV